MFYECESTGGDKITLDSGVNCFQMRIAAPARCRDWRTGFQPDKCCFWVEAAAAAAAAEVANSRAPSPAGDWSLSKPVWPNVSRSRSRTPDSDWAGC